MKKILFIIQWYPSYRSANVNCDTNIIREMLKTGRYDIHCLVYKPHNRPKYEIIDGITVHRIERDWLWTIYQRLVATPNSLAYKLVFFLYRLVLRIKQILTIPIYPMTEPWLSHRYAKAAIKLHKREHFDLVISEHFGMDTLYAGYCLKRYDPTIKFMPIFWDSLSGGFTPKFLPVKYARKKKRQMEMRIMSVADHAIFMESSLSHHLQSTSKYDYWKKMEMMNVPYLEQRFIENGKRIAVLDKKRLNIVFAGTMSQRSPQYIIQLFNKLDAEVTITFICDVSYHEMIEHEQKNFRGKLQCIPYMSYDKLQLYLFDADILLNIGVREPTAISGKIFDYMGYCKPIISTIYIDNEACIPYISRYPLGLIIDERLPIQDNLPILQNFMSKCQNINLDFENIAKMFGTSMPSSYVGIVDSLLEIHA